MQEFAEQVFFGLLLELITLIAAYFFKGRPKLAIGVFFVGTVCAGIVAFGLPKNSMTESNNMTVVMTQTAESKFAPATPTPVLALEKNEWHEENGVALRLADANFSEYGNIGLFFDFWNKTEGELIVKWSAPENIVLTDNTDHIYKLSGGLPTGGTATVPAGEIVRLEVRLYDFTVPYNDDYWLNDAVDELYVNVTGLSRIESARWRVLPPK